MYPRKDRRQYSPEEKIPNVLKGLQDEDNIGTLVKRDHSDSKHSP